MGKKIIEEKLYTLSREDEKELFFCEVFLNKNSLSLLSQEPILLRSVIVSCCIKAAIRDRVPAIRTSTLLKVNSRFKEVLVKAEVLLEEKHDLYMRVLKENDCDLPRWVNDNIQKYIETWKEYL